MLHAQPPSAGRARPAADAGAALAGPARRRTGRGARRAPRRARGARTHRVRVSPELLAGEARLAPLARASWRKRGTSSRSPTTSSSRSPESCTRRSPPLREAACSTSARAAGTSSCSVSSALDEALLPPLGDEPAGTTYPAARGRALLEPRRRVHQRRPGGAEHRHVGRATGSSTRASPSRGRGSSATSSTSGAWSRAARSRTAGNLHAWLQRTLRLEGPEARAPDGHGLTFLPLLGGERSPGWNPRATGAIAGLTFDDRRRRPAAGGARGRRLPDRRVRRPAPRGARGGRHRARAAREPRVDAALRRRARPPRHGLEGRRGFGARRGRARAGAARDRARARAARPSVRAGSGAHGDLRRRARAAARALPPL